MQNPTPKPTAAPSAAPSRAPSTGSPTHAPLPGTPDCSGVVNGSARRDRCGVCEGVWGYVADACLDCAGQLGAGASRAREDRCGACDADVYNDCRTDCAGVWGGKAKRDRCGVCSGHDACRDCQGAVQGGPSRADHCGACDTDHTNDCAQDCYGVWGGAGSVDVCGVWLGRVGCGVWGVQKAFLC